MNKYHLLLHDIMVVEEELPADHWFLAYLHQNKFYKVLRDLDNLLCKGNGCEIIDKTVGPMLILNTDILEQYERYTGKG